MYVCWDGLYACWDGLYVCWDGDNYIFIDLII